ncbi:MAG TPA: hypothetical protein VFV98_00845 [Vicinamibacterales bacterium]|nr:hypothetical protein [Vicinamibacterales bacterium]
MRGSAGIILQARMASQRLPGKSLEPLGGRSILEQCLRRLVASEAAPVVLATTSRSDDDVLQAAAEGLGIDVYRGDAANVLERYVRCAGHFGIDLVVRATADNPGVDIQAPGRVLAALRQFGTQYVHETGLPYGAAVEGVRRDALLQAAVLVTDDYDREHVTTFIRRRTDLFRGVQLSAPPALARPDVRLTVDTIDDLRRMREIYYAVRTDMPSLAELIAVADRTAEPSVA